MRTWFGAQSWIKAGASVAGMLVLASAPALAQQNQALPVDLRVAVVAAQADDDDPFGGDVKPATEDAAKEAEAKAAADKEAAVKAEAAKAEAAKKEAAKETGETKEGKKEDAKVEEKKADVKKEEKPAAIKPAAAPNDPPGDEKKGDEKKEGEGKTDDDTIEITPTKQIADPDTVKVYLADGSIVTGKLTMMDILMQTEFGELKIPVTKILSFTPGLDSTPNLGKQIAVSIEALGSADFKARDQAQKELLGMGAAVRTELSRHTADSNAERVRRIREVLTKLDEMAEESDDQHARSGWARGDTIVTDEFTVVGKIGPQEFTFESKYGNLAVALADIRTLKREVSGGGPTELRKSLAVEGTNLAPNTYKDSKIKLEAGDKVTITAGGKITMTPWGSRSTVGPEGNQRYGSMSLDGQTFAGGTLVAKVGSGKVVKVGASTTFTADKAGALQFGVTVHQSYSRGDYSFPGQYDLKIKVIRAGQ